MGIKIYFGVNYQLIESILTHKKMISAVEVVNKSATEYNIWLARKEERLSGKETQSKKTKKKKKNNNKSRNKSKSCSFDTSVTSSAPLSDF